ncbi:MAG: hypothetical protein PPP56_06575 [Longimonas sp.]|uniref:alpha/beta hydrolase n=1 Tax=Longimonas sp. TaxID=2039626 RepID=UPI0033471E81
MSRPSSHSIRTPRTAHYVQYGAPAAAHTLWIVLHGYGQRAADFIKPFQAIQEDAVCVVAPEGLSRFYTKGMQGSVGASWMTSAGRLDEIRDYLAYLNRLHASLCSNGGPRRTHVLGFSQGAATACRWVARTSAPVDRLTLWSGGMPPDIDLATHSGVFRQLDISLVLGTDDSYIEMSEREALARRLHEHDIEATSYTFDGGHRLHTDTLQKLASEGELA